MKQIFSQKEAIQYGLKEAVLISIIRNRFWLEGGAILFSPKTLQKEVPYLRPKTVQKAIANLLFYGLIEPSKEGYYRLVRKSKEF